jgi:pSer/pThr/pTyr-binding forkhead associated (FHA) protein
MPKLTVYKNRDHLFNYYIESDEIIIGRSQEADVPLDSEAVSRRHLRIRRQGSSFIAEDLSNKNGMFVNGTYASMHRLQDGDKIEIAQHLLVFHRPQSEIAEEQREKGPAQQFLMSSSQVEKILDPAAERVDEAGEGVDSVRPTTLLSAGDIHKLQAATARRRSAHLAFLHGGRRREVPLDDTVKTIGWEDGCDVRLPGRPLFGGTVAQVSPTPDGRYLLEALNFWRPVKIDGRKVKTHALRDQETIEVGGVKIRFSSTLD